MSASDWKRVKQAMETEVHQCHLAELHDFVKTQESGTDSGETDEDEHEGQLRMLDRIRRELVAESGITLADLKREVDLRKQRSWDRGRRRGQTHGPEAGGSDMTQGPYMEKNKKKKDKKVRRAQEKEELGEEEDERRQAKRREQERALQAAKDAMAAATRSVMREELWKNQWKSNKGWWK